MSTALKNQYPSESDIIPLPLREGLGEGYKKETTSVRVMIRLAINSDVEHLVNFDHMAADDPQRIEDIKYAIRDKACWIYVLDSKPVAYTILNYQFFHQGFISHLYVSPDHRRKGFAEMLIRQLEIICHKPKLFTSTNRSNKGMQGLLANMDYRNIGFVDGLDYGDPEIFYMKKLSHKT